MATRIAARYVSRRLSSSGKILGEEERAAENVYIKKMEREKLEKLARKGPHVEEPAAAAAAPAADAKPISSSSGAQKVSTDKNRNYAVAAAVVAAFGGLGWYLKSGDKKSEQVSE